MLDENRNWLWFQLQKELEAQDMSEKGIFFHYESKLEFNHDYRFKWLVVFLVDNDGSNKNAIICNEKRKRREVNLIEKSGTNFDEIEVFGKKKSSRF